MNTDTTDATVNMYNYILRAREHDKENMYNSLGHSGASFLLKMLPDSIKLQNMYVQKQFMYKFL